jgi:hypothetical protein
MATDQVVSVGGAVKGKRLAQLRRTRAELLGTPLAPNAPRNDGVLLT